MLILRNSRFISENVLYKKSSFVKFNKKTRRRVRENIEKTEIKKTVMQVEKARFDLVSNIYKRTKLV